MINSCHCTSNGAVTKQHCLCLRCIESHFSSSFPSQSATFDKALTLWCYSGKEFVNGKWVGCHGCVRCAMVVWWQAKDNSSSEWARLTQNTEMLARTMRWLSPFLGTMRHWGRPTAQNGTSGLWNFPMVCCTDVSRTQSWVIWCWDGLGGRGYPHTHHRVCSVCSQTPGVAEKLAVLRNWKLAQPLCDKWEFDRRAGIQTHCWILIWCVPHTIKFRGSSFPPCLSLTF